MRKTWGGLLTILHIPNCPCNIVTSLLKQVGCSRSRFYVSAKRSLCMPSHGPAARCLHHAYTRKAPRAPFLPTAQASNERWEASDAAQSRPSSTDDPGTTAAAVARFEAEVAPRIAAEALSEASLEDLRLQTPALRPVGCGCTECAQLSPPLASRGALMPAGAQHWLGAGSGAHLSRTRRCHNLSGASEAGLRLQLCSGCNTARYCSVTCQRLAWRAGHKGACRRLHARA